MRRGGGGSQDKNALGEGKAVGVLGAQGSSLIVVVVFVVFVVGIDVAAADLLHFSVGFLGSPILPFILCCCGFSYLFFLFVVLLFMFTLLQLPVLSGDATHGGYLSAAGAWE